MTIAEWFIAILAVVGVFSLFTRGNSDREGQLSRLEGKIDLLLEHQGLSYDPLESLEGRLKATLRSGKKILAIKMYRDATGAGLKESKEYVESLQDR